MRYVLFLLFLLSLHSLKAQSDTPKRGLTNSLYFELGGSGLLYSAGYQLSIPIKKECRLIGSYGFSVYKGDYVWLPYLHVIRVGVLWDIKHRSYLGGGIASCWGEEIVPYRGGWTIDDGFVFERTSTDALFLQYLKLFKSGIFIGCSLYVEKETYLISGWSLTNWGGDIISTVWLNDYNYNYRIAPWLGISAGYTFGSKKF